MEKSQDILSSELDVFSLLDKINETSSMLKNFQDSEQKVLLKYSKDRAIKVTESDSPGESSQSDHAPAEVNHILKDAIRASLLNNVQLKKAEKKSLDKQEVDTDEHVPKRKKTKEAKSKEAKPKEAKPKEAKLNPKDLH